MRAVFAIAAATAILSFANAAGAQTAPVPAQIPLDHFDARYGFPTFPHANAEPAVQVPVIFYGANVNALRIEDVTKIPVLAAAVPKASTH